MQPPEGSSMDASHSRDTKTPPPQKKSKAASRVPQPNFTGTPNSAPPRRHLARRVKGHAVSMEKPADRAARLKVRREERDEATDHSDQSEAGNSTYSTPLAEKPLPPRPIAQLANLQSPSKDSRSLIDATESPQKASSPSGAKREWQALTPSRTTPMAGPSTVKSEASDRGGEDSKAASPVSPVTPASVVAAAARLTNQITGGRSDNESPSLRRSVSPASSYLSATESSIIDSYKDEKASMPPNLGRKLSAPVGAQRPPLLQQRASQLRGRISSGSVIPRESGGKCDTFTDFTKEATPSSPAEDSRPHSPSAQSFSQPRPNNSFPKALSGNIKTAKKSSRVPVNEGKKATVVDIPPRASQKSSKDAPHPPKFGNRRLDAKTADLLDNGIKRRQLQRTHTAGTAKRASFSGASVDMSSAPTLNTPAGSVDNASGAYNSTDSDCDAAIKSDEDMTYAQSSCADTSEVTTPFDHVHPPDDFLKALRQNEDQKEEEEAVEDKPWDHPHLSKDSMPERCSDKTYVGVHPYPPSTSQYTNSLQTIPSQADLHASFGQAGVNINHALSQLEGRGNQSRDDVNSAAVNQMFGHLKDVWVKPEASQLKENAAAAERFLAMQEGGSRESPIAGPSRQTSPFPTFGQNQSPVAGPSRTPPPFSKFNTSNRDIHEPAVSKWSNTTPTTTSERGAMEDGSQLPNTHISQGQTPEPEPEPCRPPPPPPKDRRRTQKSFGFPSTDAETSETLTSFSDQDVVADIPNIPHRGSSPTLGQMRPGSGRAARESMTMSGALPGFAQPTKAAEARKFSRLPTPSAKTFNQQRGRSSIAPSQHEAGRPKSPRARSKSRYVMSKLNGLFHSKRDKKSIGSPTLLNGRDDLPAMRSRLPVSSHDTPARETSPTAPPVPTMSKPTKDNPRGKELKNKDSETTMDTGEDTLVGDAAAGPPAPRTDLYGLSSVHDLTDRLVARARAEREETTKQHLLNLAQALNVALVNARESQISAEQAEQAAKRAQASNELTQKAVNLLQMLAARLGDAGAVRF